MGQNDHIERFDASRRQVKCRCGARYAIYEDDGIPGCRDIETANCEFCGAELAQHFGTCDRTLIDDHDVSEMLKVARREYDNAVQAYIQKYGYNWGTREYAEIRKHWQDIVEKNLNNHS